MTYGCPEHINQLLDKVITNAVEFSQDGEIAITCGFNRSNWVVSVENKGILLPENMSSQLFDSMISVRENKSTETPHLGLGLYIARLIAEFHNGEINAENNENSDGVIVSFRLPKT